MKHDRLWNKNFKFNTFYEFCNIFIILHQICRMEFHKKIDLQQLRNLQTVTPHTQKKVIKSQKTKCCISFWFFCRLRSKSNHAACTITCAQTLFVNISYFKTHFTFPISWMYNRECIFSIFDISIVDIYIYIYVYANLCRENQSKCFAHKIYPVVVTITAKNDLFTPALFHCTFLNDVDWAASGG